MTSIETVAGFEPDSRTRPVVVVTRPNLHGDLASRLSAIAELNVWGEDAPPPPHTLASLARDATALLCFHGDAVSRALIEASPDLRLVALASVGYDTVDMAAAAEYDVLVTNTPGVLSEAVADTAFGLMLSTRRRLVEGERLVRAGQWTNTRFDLLVGLDVHDATLGIVGMGEIGRAVARRATGFNMQVLWTGRTSHPDARGTQVELDELLARSDIVTLHVPSLPETQGLIGERELRLMKPTATLINTARGAIVDETALIRALREGWIGSAGLDVQAIEPNADLRNPLLALPNVVVLPHIGSASLAARQAMVDLAVSNIEAVLGGHAARTPVVVSSSAARGSRA